jgi:hypothetical protein
MVSLTGIPVRTGACGRQEVLEHMGCMDWVAAFSGKFVQNAQKSNLKFVYSDG